MAVILDISRQHPHLWLALGRCWDHYDFDSMEWNQIQLIMKSDWQCDMRFLAGITNVHGFRFTFETEEAATMWLLSWSI